MLLVAFQNRMPPFLAKTHPKNRMPPFLVNHFWLPFLVWYTTLIITLEGRLQPMGHVRDCG
jgi:hypothetical protein